MSALTTIIEQQGMENTKLMGIIGILAAKVHSPFFGIYTKVDIERALQEEVKVVFDKVGGAVVTTNLGS